MNNKEQIKDLATNEFTTEEHIIKKGLDIFYKYIGMDNIHEYLKENKVEECINKVMNDLDMTEEEVLYLSLDTYKAFILNITLSQRLKDIKVNEYVYDFNSLTCKKVYKEISVHEILEQNRLNTIQEQEKLLDMALSKAQTILASIDKEKAEAQAKVSKIESEISKINSKILLLKSKVLTITPSQRANNRREISELESKSTILLKDLQEAKEEVKQLKNERFYMQEDISAMVKLLENPNSEGYYEVDKIKEKYR